MLKGLALLSQSKNILGSTFYLNPGLISLGSTRARVSLEIACFPYTCLGFPNGALVSSYNES